MAIYRETGLVYLEGVLRVELEGKKRKKEKVRGLEKSGFVDTRRNKSIDNSTVAKVCIERRKLSTGENRRRPE